MIFSKAVVKHRVLILILALALCVPAFFGMVATRINYDMLDYLPEDMDTVIGQNELLNDFGKGAFSLIIVEDMQPKDISAMKEKIEKVDHVETVLWYDSIFDIYIMSRATKASLSTAATQESGAQTARTSIARVRPTKRCPLILR